MLLLLGCATPAPPDPDALMRQGHLDEALAAWEAQGGRHIPADHPTATTLAKRSANEPWITLPVLADLTEAAAVLDSVPVSKTQSIDLSFEAWAPMADCSTGMLTTPWRVVVGRSMVAADPDPLESGRPFENVPYARGRVIGMAAALDAAQVEAGREAARKLFAGIDADPPSHRVTAVLLDASHSIVVNFTRRDGAWWTTSATQAQPAADWIVKCGGGG